MIASPTGNNCNTRKTVTVKKPIPKIIFLDNSVVIEKTDYLNLSASKIKNWYGKTPEKFMDIKQNVLLKWSNTRPT